MPKYQLGAHMFYRDGVSYPPHSVITLPASVEPSRTWKPLDKDAEAQIDRLKKSDEKREKLRLADLSKVPTDQIGKVVDALAAEKAGSMIVQLQARFERRIAELEASFRGSSPSTPGEEPRTPAGGKRENDKSPV